MGADLKSQIDADEWIHSVIFCENLRFALFCEHLRVKNQFTYSSDLFFRLIKSV